VHALARERVEIGRCRGDEGLALAGLHLGDVPEVQRGSAHDLDVEVPLPQRAARRFTHRGERLGEQVVDRLAVGHPLAIPVRLLAQLCVREGSHAVLEGVHLGDHTLELAEGAPLTHPQDLVEDRRHASLPIVWCARTALGFPRRRRAGATGHRKRAPTGPRT